MQPTKPEISVPDRPQRSDRDAILKLTDEFNDSKVGPSGFKELATLLLDPCSGETVGGLCGRSANDWVFVELMFVPEELRRRVWARSCCKWPRRSPSNADAWASGSIRSASKRAAFMSDMGPLSSARSRITRAVRSIFST
jgi:hypothetical protein